MIARLRRKVRKGMFAAMCLAIGPALSTPGAGGGEKAVATTNLNVRRRAKPHFRDCDVFRSDVPALPWLLDRSIMSFRVLQ
jgi:hypothetical protein